MIQYKKMSLFEAPEASIIIHACNSQGVWGRGIAAEFKKLYPHSYLDYKKFCERYNEERESACGLGSLSQFHIEEKCWVGWIVTSHNYGSKVDPVEQIKINTTLALDDLCKKLTFAHPKSDFDEYSVYSNKFNSGLFNVPWEESELILKTVLKNYKRINWIICDPDMEEKNG